MVAYLGSFTSILDEYIVKHYEFRQNVVQKILGREFIEYRRIEWDFWLPFSKFIKKEKKAIVSAKDIALNKQIMAIMPGWLIEKIAVRHSEQSETYISNQNFLKILNKTPAKITNIKPKSLQNREEVHLKEGDTCYVCMGAKKKFGTPYYHSLPGVVESIHHDGTNKYYNIFLIKIDPAKNKVMYHGRHMVFSTELGRTPEESVMNLACSQLLY